MTTQRKVNLLLVEQLDHYFPQDISQLVSLYTLPLELSQVQITCPTTYYQDWEKGGYLVNQNIIIYLRISIDWDAKRGYLTLSKNHILYQKSLESNPRHDNGVQILKLTFRCVFGTITPEMFEFPLLKCILQHDRAWCLIINQRAYLFVSPEETCHIADCSATWINQMPWVKWSEWIRSFVQQFQLCALPEPPPCFMEKAENLLLLCMSRR